MKNKLTNNIGLKFAAVLFAALLWLIVVNVDDPVDTNIYRNIPVTVTNEPIPERPIRFWMIRRL